MGSVLNLKNLPIPAAAGAHIIGKGPSLDTLTRLDFPDPSWPIFAINESIHAIERMNLPNPVFAITQDARVAMASKPSRSPWLLSKQAWKAGNGDAVPNAYQFTPALLNNSRTSTLTACIALEILHLTPIKQVRMHAFDAKFGNTMQYAKCIGYDHMKFNKDKTRFKRYVVTMQNTANKHGIKLIWIPPLPSWQVAVVVPTMTNCAARHVRAYVSAVKERISRANVIIFSDLPGGNHTLKELGAMPLAGMFKPDAFTEGFPILYLPVRSLPLSELKLPLVTAVERGKVYASPFLGDLAGALIWRAGTVTGPYDFSIKRGNVTESVLLKESLGDKLLDINAFFPVRNWPDKDASIVQFGGDLRPWTTPPGLLKVSEY